MRYWYAALALSVASIAAVPLCSQGRGHAEPPAEVAPYTARLTITKHLMMPDGSRWDAVGADVLARDRQGRTYEKTRRPPRNVNSGIESFSFFVQDPVQLRTLTWDSPGKTVLVAHWPYWAGREGCWADEYGRHRVSFPTEEDWHRMPASPAGGKLETLATIADPSGKRVKARFVSENLGQKEVHGLTAYGMRWTTEPVEKAGAVTVPETTTELWKSRELDLKLLEMVSGPRFGWKRLELSDLERGDPDPRLFEPPSGYTVETVAYRQVPCGQR